MKIPPFSLNPLNLAVAAALAMSFSAIPSRSMAMPLDIAAGTAADALAAVVTFGGGPRPVSGEGAPSVAPAIPAVLPTDIDSLDAEASTHVLAMVDATSLPLPSAEAATLSRMYENGAPVLVHMDAGEPDDLARVSALFGIAPRTGDVIIRKDRGTIQVFASSPDNVAGTPALLHAFGSTTYSRPPEGAQSAAAQHASPAAADDSNGKGSLPARHFDVNIVDAEGEVSGVTGIDIVRSRTVSDDFKMVTVTSKATVKTRNNGVSDGSKTGKNEWTADLPLEYRLGHAVTAGDAQVTYLDHFPLTDGSTEFTQTDTRSRKFSIGGNTGSEVSHSGKADDKLAAKLPFTVSAGYEYSWQSSLSTTFKDYSLQAVPSGSSAVNWKALISPKLEHVLVKRWGADMPELNEERMTPMMRAITFEAMSYWKVPGDYRGTANVTVTAGYDLDRKKWWWNRATVAHKRERVPRDVMMDFVVDLTDPYLSAEITVLIRSATDQGECLRDNHGVVDLAVCRATDRSLMWGLDAASRYVNRGTGRCLTAQMATGSAVTESCENITYAKQWQWRADRLHSMIDHTRYRLYVAGGQVHLAAKGRFPDFPVNFSSPALDPWTNYPDAPREGIDQVVGRAGTRPIVVGPEYAGLPAVSDDQRWHIEVLRQGL
jgi:hypothetical protein